ncbi:tail fiber domain-containing protein, partial [Bacteroidota bacterium]
DITWGTGEFSMEISIDNGTGFTSMGVRPFMSVPFAMFAQNGSKDQVWNANGDTLYTNTSVGIGTSTPNNSLLAIQSTDPQVEEPLFEVRNDFGNPVFAVYNDGVMVYVDEDKKGIKGGFAVGGYNKASKGITQEYLRITPDSVRIWVPEDSPRKGIKGGFAVGGYNKASKATTSNFLEVSSSNTNIFFDTTTQAKGFKGGFAVGGYNKASKGEPDQIMSLTQYNYLIGQEAGINITSGRNNTFFGWQSGYLNTEGSENIFIGRFTGYNTTTAKTNIFLGNNAGVSNTTGSNNIMVGDSAGYNSRIGFNNIFLGKEAGYSNDDGDYNIFLGYRSGVSHNTGISNIYIGDEAGSENDSSSNQVFIGDWAGAFASAGDDNVFIGGQAGIYSDVTDFNSFIGSYSGANAMGERNTFLGAYAGYNANGTNNVLLGISAGAGTEGFEFDNNTCIGSYSGYSTTSGSNNVHLGYSSGYSNTVGSGNVFIGYEAGYWETGSDKLYIANSDTDIPLIYGDFSTSNITLNGNAGVNYSGIDSYGLIVDLPDGQVETADSYTFWTFGTAYLELGYYQSSDAAYKTNIIPVDNAVSKLKQVDGVYFDYKGTKSALNDENTHSIGVIAQDVEKVFPQLVKKNMDGLKAVNYTGLIPVLIEAIKDQQLQLEAQQAEIDALKELVDSK